MPELDLPPTEDPKIKSFRAKTYLFEIALSEWKCISSNYQLLINEKDLFSECVQEVHKLFTNPSDVYGTDGKHIVLNPSLFENFSKAHSEYHKMKKIVTNLQTHCRRKLAETETLNLIAESGRPEAYTQLYNGIKARQRRRQDPDVLTLTEKIEGAQALTALSMP